jgi:endonuclease/exonuclease/phosphatase family metal-dependent hydrolase
MALPDRFPLLLLLTGLLAGAGPSWAADSTTVSLRVMTYNIRTDSPLDSGRVSWEHRRDMVASTIRFRAPAVVGTQEGMLHQLYDLEERLSGYEWVGVGRQSGGDEFSALFYRTERLELLDHHTFWLSPTPTEPGSKAWGAALPRIVTWARFRDRTTGDSLFVLNTHFDHESAEARQKSARFIAETVGGWADGAPVVVMGDLNAEVGSPPYEALTRRGPSAPSPSLRDAKQVAEQPHHGPVSTFNDFRPSVIPERRIDYILVGPDVRVRRHGHLNEKWGGAYPSDHLPVLAELVLGAG